MNATYEQVLQAARTLPEADRVQLVDALLETLAPEEALPFHDAWLPEIARRSNELDAGTVTAIPWEEVKQRLGIRSG